MDDILLSIHQLIRDNLLKIIFGIVVGIIVVPFFIKGYKRGSNSSGYDESSGDFREGGSDSHGHGHHDGAGFHGGGDGGGGDDGGGD